VTVVLLATAGSPGGPLSSAGRAGNPTCGSGGNASLLFRRGRGRRRAGAFAGALAGVFAGVRVATIVFSSAITLSIVCCTAWPSVCVLAINSLAASTPRP